MTGKYGCDTFVLADMRTVRLTTEKSCCLMTAQETHLFLHVSTKQ